ncbi:MAG: hypothetical protein KUG74_10580 [Rhodobacteraceae bacterium]|nr:hypothetical protein [Paracoccaceae bacterium]
MARGKQITKSEDSVIKLGLQIGRGPTEIAKFLGRSRQSVHNRINRMKKTGEINQMVADLGQFDE